MVEIVEIGIPSVDLWDVDFIGEGEIKHKHDYIGNWLWDDDSCILWPDGGVIAL